MKPIIENEWLSYNDGGITPASITSQCGLHITCHLPPNLRPSCSIGAFCPQGANGCNI